MATKLISVPNQKKITVTLSTELINRLDAYIPPRQRSRFIALALENQLAIEEQWAALEETAGAWADEDYPELATEQDIDNWLTNLRQSWSSK
ncbi:MAG: hypothetical protein AAF614_25875 [Chloroflexota bacterium]